MLVATVSTDLHTWSLRLLLRGDAFPVAGGSWTQISITILNAGHRAREMAFTWPLAVAWCSDKDMALLFCFLFFCRAVESRAFVRATGANEIGLARRVAPCATPRATARQVVLSRDLP